tara:strand:+ start:20589 stop:21332 length:744 start_codon:yes stop_codon:yes gene_type:complete
MSSFFEDIKNDAKEVEEKLLGPTYPYYSNIKNPSQMGLSTRGTLSQAAKNVAGLISYTEVLVTGNSKAQKGSGPLGNKFFLNTGGKCKDKASGNSVDRYIYINNQPTGNIPFVSDLGIGNFSSMKGLIPGAMTNLNSLNPFKIMGSFFTGTNPECQEITMEVVDNSNNKSSESKYVATADIKDLDPCIFGNKRNPVSNENCTEFFTSYNDKIQDNRYKLPNDPIIHLYFASVGALLLYIIHKYIDKK